MDTDIVVLRDPLPHLLSRQSNIIALMEKVGPALCGLPARTIMCGQLH